MGKRTGVPPRPPEERFWPKVIKTETCWLWTGSKNAQGYGTFNAGGNRPVYVHRFAYELLVGPIPKGLTLDHLCRVPLCVKPDHLEPVTHQENISRASAARTHCRKGHPLDGTYRRGTGRRRYCLTCNREKATLNRARTRAVDRINDPRQPRKANR